MIQLTLCSGGRLAPPPACRRRNVRVWLSFLAFAFLGLELGVCTAQHLTKSTIRAMNPIILSATAHQYTC